MGLTERLRGSLAEQVYSAWNTCIKLAWHVPRGTHTYFVDRLLGCNISHVRTDMLAKYVNFFKSLRLSPSMEVSVLSHIVAFIREVTALDPWCCTSGQVRKVLGEEQAEVPAQDGWRLVYLEKLLAQRGEWHYELRNTSELTELIDSLCVN